jgi:signal transduction histidine kinase
MRLDIDREKSLFLRTVTHELRSPLNAVASILGVLRQVCAGDLGAKQADLVNRALQRVNFLQTLVDDLLDLAAGKAEVLNTASRERVSLNGSLSDACTRFEPQAKAKRLELLLSEPEEDLAIWCDRSELDRVLNNLLSNAVKYTNKGEVRVSIVREGDGARLAVADTGIGIPKSAMSQLFEEFFRAPNAKAMDERGTGLGLAIIKDLVARYGGTISVESTEGQGTVFTLLLPLASAPVP